MSAKENCGNSARAVSIVVTSSLQSVCEKATNIMDTYKLVSTAVNRSTVNVKVSSDAGTRKVSEAVTPERASPVHKHSQQFSPETKLLATKSF